MAIPEDKRILPAVKPPRIIVEHFDIATYKIDQAHGYVEADCQHCGATIKGQKNVTSNFIQHMRRRHPDAYDRFAASSQNRAKRPRLSTPSKPSPSPPTPIPQPTFTPVRRPPSPILTRPELTLETALVSATYRAALRTPCDSASRLSSITNCQLYVKREDLQIASSPIFRAAYNYLAATPTSRSGVVASGPTALSLAAAAHKHSKPCYIYLPHTASAALRRALTAFGAKYESIGETLGETVGAAQLRAAETNRTYVDLSGPLRAGFADAVAGYATLALEILQQRPHADRVFMSGGNAPLFAGVSAVLQRLGRGVKLVGVVLRGEPREDWVTYTADVVEVSHDEMCAAVKLLFEDCDDCLLEPFGALSVAGAIRFARDNKLSHERFVCVVSDSLKGFDTLEMVTRRVGNVDGSRCLLCVRKAGEVASLSSLMQELRGTAGGRARVTCVRFGGTWPVLLGLACDETTTAAAHVANLLSLGYRASDVTGSLRDADMDVWQRDDGEWAVFRVELVKSAATVIDFLSVERELPLQRVSFEDDESATAKFLVATKRVDWQLEALQADMTSKAFSVERISTSVGGLSIMGCGVPEEDGFVDVAQTEQAKRSEQGIVAEGSDLPIGYVETDEVVGEGIVDAHEDHTGARQDGQEVSERQDEGVAHEEPVNQELQAQDGTGVEDGHGNVEGQTQEDVDEGHGQTHEMQVDGMHEANTGIEQGETQEGATEGVVANNMQGGHEEDGMQAECEQVEAVVQGQGEGETGEMTEATGGTDVAVAEGETAQVIEDAGERSVHVANGVANEEVTMGNESLDTGVVLTEVDASVVQVAVEMETVEEPDGAGSLEAGAVARLDADLERVAQADAMVGGEEAAAVEAVAAAAAEAIQVPART